MADHTLDSNYSERFRSMSFLKSEIILTGWKFQDFSVTQILREIKFGDSRSAKTAILTHLEAINFDFL